MAMPTNETINQQFMLAWDAYGDEKSTEFLVWITVDQLGIEPKAVYEALAAVHDTTPTTEGTK